MTDEAEGFARSLFLLRYLRRLLNKQLYFCELGDFRRAISLFERIEGVLSSLREYEASETPRNAPLWSECLSLNQRVETFLMQESALLKQELIRDRLEQELLRLKES